MPSDRENERVLDLGCGRKAQAGAIGLDISPESGADVVADMDAPHFPFKDGAFDEVVMTDALEHVADVKAALSEAARILRPGGAITARVPHFSSLHMYSDFTHRHFFSAEGIRRMTQEHPEYSHYYISGFKLERLDIKLWRAWRIFGIEWMANRFPLAYEKLFAFRFPAMALEFRLTTAPKSVNKTV